ncbi:ArnT family glycosyltransferase [Candidatus Puniceispirillum sp.]|uniref:ArnT family glycosyltransferase n=1 Tax=Candidatus Puniceispirillum sp. TaxID=2026719 RepID=UPI003F698E5C
MSLISHRSILYLLLGLLTIFVLIGHQLVPPMDRDEARFAQASKQMVESGDFVTVRFQEDLRAKKPVGIYWLQSVSAQLFGDDDIAVYRVPSLLGLLLALVGTYRAGLLLYQPRLALIGTAFLGTSLVVFAEAHLAKTDALLMGLCVWQQLSLLMIYRAYLDGTTPPRSAFLAFWVIMGLAVLVKGPIAPLLALLTALSLVIWHRDLGLLRRMRVLSGLAIVAALVLPWATLVSLATDGAFLDIAIKGDFLAKIQSGQESHGAPPGTYLVLLAVLLWPACLLLPRALLSLRQILANSEARFLVAWLVPFWFIIELTPTKLPHYPLPVLPALALLCVVGIRTALPQAKLVRYTITSFEFFSLLVAVIFAMLLIWGAINYGGENSVTAFAFAGLGTIAAACASWFGLQWILTQNIRPLGMMLAAAMAFNIFAIAGLLPSLHRIHLSTAINKVIAQMPTRPAAIAAAGYHEPSLVFLLGKDLLLLNGREAAFFLGEASGGVALIESREHEMFLETAKALGLKLDTPIQVSGINISKGQSAIMLIYRVQMFDGASRTG